MASSSEGNQSLPKPCPKIRSTTMISKFFRHKSGDVSPNSESLPSNWNLPSRLCSAHVPAPSPPTCSSPQPGHHQEPMWLRDVCCAAVIGHSFYLRPMSLRRSSRAAVIGRAYN